MAKRTKKRSAHSTTPARRRSGTGRQKAASPEAPARSGTKQARAIEMLRSKEGASLAALMDATGWQQHSVRGFLAGVVRKRLRLNLASAVDDGVRTYRITGEPAASSSKDQRAQSKSP
jgi:hypothetical protein